MSAGFDKRLLGQNLLNRLPCFGRNILQMSVRIHTNQIAQPHAGADERCETAAVFAAVQLHTVRRPGRKRVTLADQRAGFIGDLPLSNRLLKKRIGKSKRPVMRHHMKGIVQYQKRALKQRAGIGRQGSQVILREELGQKRIGSVALSRFFFHLLIPFACAESTSLFLFIIP